MSDPVDLQTTIETAAQAPASATSDGQSVTQQDLDKLIRADQYLQGKAATTSTRKGVGLVFRKLLPPGAV